MHHESGEERSRGRKNEAFFLFGEFIHLALEIFVWEKRGNGPTMKTISKKVCYVSGRLGRNIIPCTDDQGGQ